MACCEQRWKPGQIWVWAILGSLVVHGLIVAVMLAALQNRPLPRRVVVPVEAVTLVPFTGSSWGGSGQPGPVTRPAPSTPKPAAPPVYPPRKSRIKHKARPKVKLAPPPEPTKAPVLPAPITASTRAKPAPATAATNRTGGSGAAGRVAGQGQGGAGVGRGTGSGSGMGSGQGRGTITGSALSGYLGEIRRLLEKHKDYPWMARRRHLQGVVAVVFTIGSGGQIEAARISRSSGHALLDRAAQDTVRRVGRFPPFPAALNRQKLTIEVPLAFRLRAE
jgi:protein TonB